MILHYNKQTKQITQTQSEDTIPMTDELMADYRHYAGNQQDKSLELIQEVGQVPYLVKYKLDDEGNRYSHYLDEVDEDGYKLPDLVKLAEIQVNQAKTYFTNEIQKHINKAIAEFNATHGVEFENLANIDSAGNRTGYSLQAECKAFADWAYVTVWDTMRAWEKTLTEIPTEAEFQAKLDSIPAFGA